MRLRTLTEAECYARCYGGRSDERVSIVRVPQLRGDRALGAGEHLRELFEQRLDARGIERDSADADAEAA